MIWDDGDASVPDGEVTQATADAFAAAERAADAAFGPGYTMAYVGSEMRVRPDHGKYVAVVRGQSSATGHGKHGSHPARIAEYREMTVEDGTEVPVWLVYIESGGNVAYTGWLHALPEAHPISTVTGAERYGWNARKDPAAFDAELQRSEGTLAFPTAIPEPEPNLFGGI